MILPAEALRRRISRVQALVAYLDRLKPVDREAYEGDIALQLRIERVAQLLTQSLVDVGASLLDRMRSLESAAPRPGPAGDKENLVSALAEAGILGEDLARRLADLPELAEILVHEYVEIDPATVWRIWRERRGDLAAAASSFAAYLTRNKVLLQL